MCEKLPSKSVIALLRLEVLIAITLEFLYQYNLPIKKVNFVIYITSGLYFTSYRAGHITRYFKRDFITS
jgi:hypothetical protein